MACSTAPAKTVTCLFWVAPTRRLWDLFVAIDGVADPAEVARLASLHEVDFLPPHRLPGRGLRAIRRFPLPPAEDEGRRIRPSVA